MMLHPTHELEPPANPARFTAVDSDPLNITSSGFNLRLQEEEAEDGIHSNETVGYIAIQSGGTASSGTANTFGGLDENIDTHGLGATFSNAIVVAETQTINGGDTATVVIDSQTNSSVSLFLEEEQSRDTEVNHINETVGIVAFNQGLILCLAAGTLVDTETGLRPVESLETGDKIRNANGEAVPLRLKLSRRLEHTTLAQMPKFRPIRLCAGSLGAGLPGRDLLVSPQHRMLVRSKTAQRMFGKSEVLVSATRLTALPGIYRDDTIEQVEYIHLVFDEHQIIFAEGAPTESFYMGAQAVKGLASQAAAELRALFPHAFCKTENPVPARLIPKNHQQKRLVERLQKNNKPVWSQSF